ncbi:MAG: universal stress protein [Flavobacteriales bacterium]|nr:universal stress protein [Flavobacteriales bacterium]
MKYLVPYDFTPITRSALEHALSIRNDIPGEIELLHIVDGENDREQAEFTLTGLISSLPEDQQDEIFGKVRVGSIYKDIAQEADEGDADLLVMGTHGAKGLQKIFGSRAIKVITSSNTPFIVTQAKGPEKEIELIVLPVDLSKESLQVVSVATNLAKRFNAAIHVVCKAESDEYLSHRLRNNINWAKMKISDEVDYAVVELKGDESLADEVIDYAEKHGADMFAITHFTDSILPQFDSFTQEMITNRLELPTLVLSAKQVSDINSNYTFIGM